MRWSEVREAHPDQWVVMEALDAHSEPGRWVVELMSVVDTCPDGLAAMHRYGELRRAYRGREFFFFHTSNREIVIEEDLGGLPWGHARRAAR